MRAKPRTAASTVVLDNSSTHKTPDGAALAGRPPALRLHFTPTSASWLDLVECWFAKKTTNWLAGGPIDSVG